MKKFLVILFISICVISVLWYSYNTWGLYPSTQEYVAGTNNIKGNVDIEHYLNKSPEFEIGANIYGYAVFKKPKKAFEVFLEKYAVGIDLIKKQYGLEPLTRKNYKPYAIYGWQTNSGTDEEQEQARFVTQFLGIYENSFEHDVYIK